MEPKGKKWWQFFVVVFAFLGIMALIGIEYLAWANIDPLINKYKSTQERFLEMYLDDVAYLANWSILKPVTGQHDAGPTLNQKFSWSLGANEAKPFMPNSLREKILRYDNDWVKYYKRIKYERFDFGVFAELEKFDYWDIEENSPIAELMNQNKFQPPGVLPSPDALEISVAAKVYLMRGLNNSDVLAHLKAIRHLAKLLLSTENIHLVTAGLNILDYERMAFNMAVEQDLLKESDWTPESKNRTRRAIRALWGTRGYLFVWTDQRVFGEVFFENQNVPVGICAAFNESLPIELTLRPLLKSHWPFERDLRPGYQRVEAAYMKYGELCRIKYFRQNLQKNILSIDWPMPDWLGVFPYSRRVFGLKLSAMNFTGFDAYEVALSKMNL